MEDIILSEGDNEVLNLIRINRKRRYENEKDITGGNKNTNMANPVRFDEEGRDSGEDRDVREESPRRGRASAKSVKRNQEVTDNESTSREEESIKTDSEENYSDKEITNNSIEENPLDPARGTKEENFRNIRNALKASRNRVSELETEVASRDEKLKALDEVDSLKSQLEEANKKLEALQKYEDIIGLYGTEGFKEEYYDKVDNIKKGILDLAKDYNVEDSVIDTAIGIKNQRELNEYLGQYFDVYSVQDIRKSIKEIQEIVAAREEAENNPVKTREYLLTNFAKRKDAISKQSRENIKLASMSAWQEMSDIYSNQSSGVEILQEKNGNKEHNDIRLGILNNSSKEFGKLIAVLNDNGLQSLPSNVARALASRFQLGETAAYSIVQAEQLKKENDELRAELKKFTNYQRPLGAAGSSGVVGKTVNNDLKGKDLTRYLFSRASEVN